MVLEDTGACAAQPAAPIVALGVADVPEMLALARVTQPGPFGPRTAELGDYIGIRQRGVLVAMAGERMRIAGFTEISAVCTHPDHVGRGHAAGLMLELMAHIRNHGETPFLHVRHDNTRAIQLYERLGFRQKREFQLSLVQKYREEQLRNSVKRPA